MSQLQGELVTEGNPAMIDPAAAAPAAPAAAPARPTPHMPTAAMAQQESSTTQLDTGSDDLQRCQRCKEGYPLHYFPNSYSTAPDGSSALLCYRCRSEFNAQHWPRKCR